MYSFYTNRKQVGIKEPYIGIALSGKEFTYHIESTFYFLNIWHACCDIKENSINRKVIGL